MVLVASSHWPQPVFFPVNFSDLEVSTLTIEVRDTTSRQLIPATVRYYTADTQNIDADLTFPDGIAVGEYRYTLKNGEETISDGLLLCRPASNNTEQYEQPIEFIQYEG